MFRSLCLAFALCFMLCSYGFSDDPPVIPGGQINAPANATGKGTRDAPYIFALGAKGDLRLAAATEKVTWLLGDAPSETEILSDSKRLWFPTDTPGLYVAIAAWVDGDKPGAAMCWFEIKGPNSPPKPNPVNEIESRLKSVLIGPDAKLDAAKLAGLSSGVADLLAAGQFNSMGDLGAAWKAGQSASQWPAAKYPGLPDVIRLAVPIADETKGPVIIDAGMRALFVTNLRVIEKTARAISNG